MDEPQMGRRVWGYAVCLCSTNSGDGNDINPALPDTSMKLGRYVYKHELFEIFSLANQNYSNFQDGGSKFQDGCQNKYQIRKWCSSQ